MISHKKRKWSAVLSTLLLLAAIWFLNVSRPGRHVEGCPLGCAIPPPLEEESLRVLSLNMLHGHPRFSDLDARLELIASEIIRMEADIVLLQEVPWTARRGSAAAWLAEQTGMNHLYLRANGGRWTIFFEEGEAILSRYPLHEAQFTALSPRAGWFENRVVLQATAETSLGDLNLFVTHLTHGEPEVNQAQAAVLKTFVASHAGSWALIAGDFNAQPDSPQIIDLSTAWTDTFAAANPGDAGRTCCIAERSAPPGEVLEKRIDYIFMLSDPGEIIIEEARVVFDEPFQTENGWQYASDHAGLLLLLSR